MTRYIVEYWAKRYCVRPELFAEPRNVRTDYLRAVKIADYLNLRMRRRTRTDAARIAA